jgi:hypothetical protein
MLKILRDESLMPPPEPLHSLDPPATNSGSGSSSSSSSSSGSGSVSGGKAIHSTSAGRIVKAGAPVDASLPPLLRLFSLSAPNWLERNLFRFFMPYSAESSALNNPVLMV